MSTRLWWARPETFVATPAALDLLDAEERARHQRYIPPAKRQEFLLARVMVRRILGEMLGLAPQTLRFERNPWGRPAVAPDLLSQPLHFNVSHTDGLVVCLVSTDGEIGVDTEALARAPAVLKLAPRVFSARERADLAALPEAAQGERALLLWTLKESYIKARGMGLALRLTGFAFRFDAEGIAIDIDPDLNDAGARWQFQTQCLGAHRISIALDRGDALTDRSAAAATIDCSEFR